MGRVISVNIAAKKGPKEPVGQAELKVGRGLAGDVHAAPGIRQVSLLARESVDKFQESPNCKVCLFDGIFGENIRTEGVKLHTLAVGTPFQVGGARLEVSQIGKVCHKPCGIAARVGDCIMPREGIFAIVISGGIVKPGDKITILKK